MNYDAWKLMNPEDAGFYQFEVESEEVMTVIDGVEFDRAKYVEILGRGLCSGVGNANGQMCIEAAISQACGLPFGDDPACVLPAVRSYKIRLNDAGWSSDTARAKGLFKVGIAQLGSSGSVDPVAFAKRIAEQTIRELLPAVFRAVFTLDTVAHKACLMAADRCEAEGTEAAARAAAEAAARAAADRYLLLGADICLRVLRELGSPGCELLEETT